MPPPSIGAAYAHKSQQEAEKALQEYLTMRKKTHGQIITPHTPDHSTSSTQLASLNPALLLDPKRGIAKSASKHAATQSHQPHNQQQTPLFSFSSPNDAINLDHDQGNDQMYGSASLFERGHNLEDRVDRPNKRLKRSTSPSSSEASRSSHRTSGQRHGGGSVVQHLKDRRNQIANQEGSTAPLMDLTESTSIDLTTDEDAVQTLGNETENIDLTAEAEEGERAFYQVNGKKVYFDENDVDEKEVCYGRLEGTRVIAFLVPNPMRPISTRPEWPAMKVNFVREVPGDSGRIKAMDMAGKHFGNLDVKTAYALKSLLSSPIYRLRLDARLDIRSKEAFESPGQPMSKHLNVTVHLYGPRKYAVNPVGKVLSQKQVWLRQPKWVNTGKDVFNPHCNDPTLNRQAKKAGIVMAGGNAATGVKYRTAEQEQNEISSLFENLQRAEDLPFVEPDSAVVRELLPHQKQALGWMIKREEPCQYDKEPSAGSMWRREVLSNGDHVYVNVITAHSIREVPKDTLGGLLADMMGLGKTLQLLALLSYTKPKAVEFVDTAATVTSPDHVRLWNVKTTLLICPLSVISNWEDQITSHIKDGALTYYVFHGPQRKKDASFLSQFDVVLTTYPTVKSEYFPGNRAVQAADHSPLAQMNFFRVVLDEAHFIRTSDTMQFKAAIKLNATRRWCLTATPIQNRLEDLGSIMRFLRVAPFDVASAFTQFIISPFRLGDPEAVKRLRILVDTVTLRRLKDKIDLAPRRDETVALSFSETEQQVYDFFANDASKRVQAITSGAQASAKHKLAGKGYLNILRSILCLRQISAHGRDLLKEEDLQMMEGQDTFNAIDVEEEDTKAVIDPRQAYEMFDLIKDGEGPSCRSCGFPVLNCPKERDDEDPVIATMLPCYEIVCNACVKALRKTTNEALKHGDERMVCPFCSTAWRIHLFDLTVSGVAQYEQQKEDMRTEPRKAKIMARYNGPHTKTTALIDCLLTAVKETESLKRLDPKEKPIKSVVFSAWTTHLDLIGIALSNNYIQYNMLTGSMNRKQRKEALREFTESDDTNVILISIGTGGVGLNLTAASRVFLMDIGFNPMAEQQAVDRVHRLGQKREVTFTRFLMSGSIEEKILELQKKKMDLADLSLQRGKIDKTEAARRRLEDLKELFK